MRRTFTIVGVLALTVVASRAEAQSGSRIKLGAAFGPGWETRGAGGPSGTHLALSATLNRASSRLSYRLETMLDDAEQARRGTESRVNLHRHATFALTVSAVRRFSKQSTTGAYAIGGVGLYHQWNEVIQRRENAGEERTGLWSSVRPGVNVGLGLTFTIRHQEMFVESRYHTTGFESRIPISLGVRI